MAKFEKLIISSHKTLYSEVYSTTTGLSCTMDKCRLCLRLSSKAMINLFFKDPAESYAMLILDVLSVEV